MRRWWLTGILAVMTAVAIWFTRPASEAPVAGTRPPATSRSGALPPDLVAAVRASGRARDFIAGADLVAAHRAVHGPTPENVLALSWLGRAALDAGELDRADAFARETYDLAGRQLATRSLDEETRLPTALGAAIEVMGQAAARRGARTEALLFLQAEAARFVETSIAKRIQKNIHLISLEGRAAPDLDRSEFLGEPGAAPASLEGRVVLMFFWAHWCSDCKAQAPVLASLLAKYADRGLTIVAPTQRFGYVAGGREAGPDEERMYIRTIREQFYPMLERVAIPLAAANHERYGVSTTPTLVLTDRTGVIRLYHPGMMTAEQLEPRVRDVIERQVSAPASSTD